MENSANNKIRSLSDNERLLLMTYHDRECGFLSCWRAKRLLNRSSEAVDFFNSLDELCIGLKTAFEESTPELKCSLWSSISRRIEEEDRAALYLGARTKIEQPRPSFFAPLGWSVAGGLVAASVTVFIAGNFSSSSAPTVSPVSNQIARTGGAINQINMAAQNDELPRILEPGDPRVGGGQALTFASQSPQPPRSLQNSVDVDWVRSAGAVRFFSDPNQHSTMIRVKKRSPAVRFYSSPVKVVTPREQPLSESLSSNR